MSKQLIDPSLPLVEVNFRLKNHLCSESDDSAQYIHHLLGTGEGKRCYMGVEKPSDGQIAVACLDLRNLAYDDYIANVKKRDRKQAVIRNARKADKLGFICKPFVRSLYVPDIVAINQSKDVRSCGPMKPSYQRSVEEMGGEPTKYMAFEFPDCPLHYGFFWGIFSPEQGHRQGSIVTNERLLAYVRIIRFGNFATYSMILGHGDYLKHGIMYRLHFKIMEWLCQKDNPYSHGLEYLMYAGYYDGDEGLTLWKKKTCFEPVYLILSDDKIP